MPAERYEFSPLSNKGFQYEFTGPQGNLFTILQYKGDDELPCGIYYIRNLDELYLNTVETAGQQSFSIQFPKGSLIEDINQSNLRNPDLFGTSLLEALISFISSYSPSTF